MRRTIIVALTAASTALLLAACSTTSEQQTAADAQQASGSAPGRDSTASSSGTPGTRGPGGMSARDANSQLGKRTVYYDYDKFDVKPEYRGIVEAHAKNLREHPNLKMVVEGNADERGSREYNVGLGQRRSESLKRMLLLLGAKESQIESVSFGEEKPVCTNQAEDCWWKNRRGDIRYAGE